MSLILRIFHQLPTKKKKKKIDYSKGFECLQLMETSN